jgi:hypothetical protein
MKLAALVAVLAMVGGGVACSGLRNGAPGTTSTAALEGEKAKSGGGLSFAPAPAPTSAPAAAIAPGAPAPIGAPPAIVTGDAAQRSAVSQNATDSLAAQAPSSAAAQPVDRMVIRTAQLAVEVTDIEGALAQVRQIAQQGGGFVSGSSTRIERVNDQERTIADLTIQVRSETVDSSLSALRALGKVTTESSGSQDVTEEYVDLDSNLRNLQASETAILKLMDKTTRIEDVLALQRELTNVRGQIERIQGRKRFLERRADMATIAISLRLPPVEGSRSVLGGAWDPFAVAARGWQASLTVLRGLAEAVIVVIAFSWWMVPIAGAGIYFWQQRRRPRPAPPTTPAGA